MFQVREEDWEIANRFLADKPDGYKLRRKDTLLVNGQKVQCQNSFVVFRHAVTGNRMVIAFDRRWLNEGSYSRVKRARTLTEDLVVKVQNGRGQKKNQHRENECAIETDLGLLIAAGKRKDHGSEKSLSILRYLGEDLVHFWLKKKTFTAREVVTLFLQCVSEVQKLHNGEKSRTGKKYLHGDIKLENFLIDDSGIISLIDFGFSSPLPEGEYTARGHNLRFFDAAIFVFFPCFKFDHSHSMVKVLLRNTLPRNPAKIPSGALQTQAVTRRYGRAISADDFLC